MREVVREGVRGGGEGGGGEKPDELQASPSTQN